jgi:hypothetical protein
VDARASYEEGNAARSAEVAQLEGRERGLGTLRVVVALGAVAALVDAVWGPWAEVATAACVVLVAAFVFLVAIHARAVAARELAEAGRRFHQRGLARLDDTWSTFTEDGTRFVDDEHPFSSDLDLFGPRSLFQRLNAAETFEGQGKLAAWLASDPPSTDELEARHAAVRELGARTAFRADLSAEAHLLGGTRPQGLVKWAAAPATWTPSSALRLAGLGLPLAIVLAFAAHRWGPAPGWIWIALVVGAVAFNRMVGGQVAPVVELASTRETAIARFATLFARIEREAFTSARLVQLRERLVRSGTSATAQMARLARIVSFVDARQNEFFRLFLGPVLLWDLNCAVFVERWRSEVGASVGEWFDALHEMEALASLAGFAFETPDATFPRFSNEPQFVAEALGHPLVPRARRVDNDVSLPGAGDALVVTGSNMAGKTTMLRAIGVTAQLAFTGAPVTARSLVLGRMAVSTSMRIRDSLGDGVSRFYAEVSRLKLVTDRAAAGPSLFLLDEILHGTNMRERLIGARGLVLGLLGRGALGAVSTHDLALGDLAAERPGHVHNVHFEEQVEGEVMTFDYRLRPGVVTSSNALRLMRAVGLDVGST